MIKAPIWVPRLKFGKPPQRRGASARPQVAAATRCLCGDIAVSTQPGTPVCGRCLAEINAAAQRLKIADEEP